MLGFTVAAGFFTPDQCIFNLIHLGLENLKQDQDTLTRCTTLVGPHMIPSSY